MINNIPLIPGLCIGLPSVFGYMCHLLLISSDIISPVLLWNIIVNWADSNGNVREAQIPEQCRHTIQDGVIASSVSDLYHWLHLHLLRYLTPMFVPKTSVWYCMIFTQKILVTLGKMWFHQTRKPSLFALCWYENGQTCNGNNNVQKLDEGDVAELFDDCIFYQD